MPTLYGTIEDASEEATELLSRYRQSSVLIRRCERIYFEGDKCFPGFDAIIRSERESGDNTVAIVTKRGVTLCDTPS